MKTMLAFPVFCICYVLGAVAYAGLNGYCFGFREMKEQWGD